MSRSRHPSCNHRRCNLPRAGNSPLRLPVRDRRAMAANDHLDGADTWNVCGEPYPCAWCLSCDLADDDWVDCDPEATPLRVTLADFAKRAA